jgi:hypothetical protein
MICFVLVNLLWIDLRVARKALTPLGPITKIMSGIISLQVLDLHRFVTIELIHALIPMT